MKEYTFVARDQQGKILGTVTLIEDKLPSHLSICMAVLGEHCKATTYSMIGLDGKELESCPVNPERYLSHEFRQILEQCNRSWLYARVEYTGGFHQGEQGRITGFVSYREGHFFSVCWESGAYSFIGSSELSIIKVIRNENTGI